MTLRKLLNVRRESRPVALAIGAIVFVATYVATTNQVCLLVDIWKPNELFYFPKLMCMPLSVCATQLWVAQVSFCDIMTHRRRRSTKLTAASSAAFRSHCFSVLAIGISCVVAGDALLLALMVCEVELHPIAFMGIMIAIVFPLPMLTLHLVTSCYRLN